MHHDKQAALADERDSVKQDEHDAGNESRTIEATRLDREIKAMCTHDSIYWNSRADDEGRILTTCERCGVSWYEHVE